MAALLLTTALGLSGPGAASADDCNGDGVPDDQQLIAIATFQRAADHGQDSANITFPQALEALGDVEIDVSAWVKVEEPTEYGDVYVDGTFIGRLFASLPANFSCWVPTNHPATESLTVPAAVWNAARAQNNNNVPIYVEYEQVNWPRCTEPRTRITAHIPADNDCDDDGVLNECETDDCDGNGVSDGCQSDADADGIIDACELDCNQDGIPDEWQFESLFSHRHRSAGFFQCDANGEGVGMHAPPAISDVTLTLDVLAQNVGAADEWMDLRLNDVTIATFFQDAGSCSRSQSVTLTAAEWNAARDADGYMPLALVGSPAYCVAPQCGGPLPFIDLRIEYTWDADLDDNGWLDSCATRCDPDGPDGDADGVSDACDLCPDTISGHPYVDEYGCPLATTPVDRDQDGDVDQLDVADFLACDAGPNVAPAAGCEPADFRGDNDVDLHDYLDLQDAASGSGTLAELASAGHQVPDYIRVDTFLNTGVSPSWDYANLYCQEAYGTELATIDPALPASAQQARIDAMTSMAGIFADKDFWIGLRYEPDPNQGGDGSLRFRWADGPLLIPIEEVGGTSLTNWGGDGTTPNQGNFSASGVRTYYVTLWSQENHKWLNILNEDNSDISNVQGFLANMPPITVGSEDNLTPATFDVRLTAGGSSTIAVLPGESVVYDLRGVLDSMDTLGLAGFACDVSFDGGSLAPMSDPGGLSEFIAPAGYNNPGGFGGTVIGGELIQVGGGQNTINNSDPGGPTGQVTTGVAHVEEVLATGTLTAPTTPGTYTITVSNVHATTINPGETGGPVWRCEPAVAGATTNLTIVVACGDDDGDGVCNDVDSCPGFDDSADSDGDGTPDGCDVCPGSDDGVDADGDGTPDGCDICPGFDDNVDSDGDGVADGCDNCPGTPNMDQADTDGDGVGDACAPPANDDCGNAALIGNETVSGVTLHATSDGASSCDSASNWPDVWYRYTATCDGYAEAGTCGTDGINTVLTVLDVCGGNELACSSFSCPGFDSAVWQVSAGTEYLIRVSGNHGGEGSFDLWVDCQPSPANDDCANAEPINNGNHTGAITYATTDGPGACGAAAGRDVWFSYTNDTGVDTELFIDTCSSGTSFDTVLAVYDACGGSPLACSDDSGNCGPNADSSLVSLIVPCDATVLIQLASRNDTPGQFQMGFAAIPNGPDSDGDGLGDSCDVCPGFDDNIDSDGNGIPDGCEPACPGDADGDLDVDVSDLALLLSQFGMSGSGLGGDVDNDGDVDLSDLSLILSQFGNHC